MHNKKLTRETKVKKYKDLDSSIRIKWNKLKKNVFICFFLRLDNYSLNVKM